MDIFNFLLDQYFYTTRQGSTYSPTPIKNPLAQNSYFSKSPNKSNFIIIQSESFDKNLLFKTINGKLLTPVLNKLSRKSLFFTNFYSIHSAGGSSDAEISSITGLLPLSEISTISFFPLTGLPSICKILSEYGYNSYGFHSNDGRYWNRTSAYRDLGFKNLFDSNYYTVAGAGFFSYDNVFLSQTFNLIKDLPHNKPFLYYINTQSMHSPYKTPINTELKFQMKKFINLSKTT